MEPARVTRAVVRPSPMMAWDSMGFMGERARLPAPFQNETQERRRDGGGARDDPAQVGVHPQLETEGAGRVEPAVGRVFAGNGFEKIVGPPAGIGFRRLLALEAGLRQESVRVGGRE